MINLSSRSLRGEHREAFLPQVLRHLHPIFPPPFEHRRCFLWDHDGPPPLPQLPAPPATANRYHVCPKDLWVQDPRVVVDCSNCSEESAEPQLKKKVPEKKRKERKLTKVYSNNNINTNNVTGRSQSPFMREFTGVLIFGWLFVTHLCRAGHLKVKSLPLPASPEHQPWNVLHLPHLVEVTGTSRSKWILSQCFVERKKKPTVRFFRFSPPTFPSSLFPSSSLVGFN